MADKIKPSIRQAAAIALVAIGALAAAPWLVKITLGQINRPESEWGVAPVCGPFVAIPAIPPIRISISRGKPKGLGEFLFVLLLLLIIERTRAVR